MTLTRRLTIVVVSWIVVILAVFNVIYLARIQTQAYSTLRNTLQLELSDAWNLNQRVPHLAVTASNWEDSILVFPSTVRFYDKQGRITSVGSTEGFPNDALAASMSAWWPEIHAQVQQFVQANVTPTDGGRPRHDVGGIVTPSLTEVARLVPHLLPETDGTLLGTRGLRFIGMVQPVVYPDDSVGVIVVAATMDTVINALQNALHGLLWTDAPVILIAGLGTYLVTARGLRPMQSLIEAIQTVEWSLMSRVYVGRAPHEVQTLADTLNQLLDRVEDGLKEQRRFVADASHELRTPLAIIAGHANVLRRWGNTNDEVWEPAVHHIVNEVGRLQMLVDNLLLLARLDAGDKPEYDPIPSDTLRQMVTQLREDGNLLRPDLQWTSAVHMPSRCFVQIQQNALRQVLVSLIDNAIKHTPSGGTVALSAVVDGGEVCIAIEDSGTGIPPEDIPRVFDRFYRGQTARKAKQAGSGLGLSICKQLVEAYGGTIAVQSDVTRGTTVQVRVRGTMGADPDVLVENDDAVETVPKE